MKFPQHLFDVGRKRMFTVIRHIGDRVVSLSSIWHNSSKITNSHLTSELTRRRESKPRSGIKLVTKHARAARVKRFVGLPPTISLTAPDDFRAFHGFVTPNSHLNVTSIFRKVRSSKTRAAHDI